LAIFVDAYYIIADAQQQYLFAIGGWKPEGHKPMKADSNALL